jgi:hypothetical protein
LSLALTGVIKAQEVISGFQLEFRLDPNNVSLDSLGQKEYDNNTKHNVVFNFKVADTLNVRKIEISLGSSVEETNFFKYSINYDGSSIPRGVEFKREAGNITIDAGKYANINIFYATVRLKFNDGTNSDFVKISNAQ